MPAEQHSAGLHSPLSSLTHLEILQGSAIQSHVHRPGVAASCPGAAAGGRQACANPKRVGQRLHPACCQHLFVQQDVPQVAQAAAQRVRRRLLALAALPHCGQGRRQGCACREVGPLIQLLPHGKGIPELQGQPRGGQDGRAGRHSAGHIRREKR